MQKENLVTVKIEVCLVTVKANLGGGLTKMVVGVVVFVTGAIEIIKELVVFMGYKASKLKMFGVTVAEKVGKSVKVVG